MKKLAILTLLSLVGVVVFGFVAMSDKHGNGEMCLSTIVAPAGCPEGPTFSKTFFHSNIYQGFSSGVFLAVIVLLFLALTSAIALEGRSRFAFLAIAEKIDLAEPDVIRKIVRWLKLYEKRDSASI